MLFIIVVMFSSECLAPVKRLASQPSHFDQKSNVLTAMPPRHRSVDGFVYCVLGFCIVLCYSCV